MLQPLAAKPMLGHVLDTARVLEARRIVVVYGGGEVVREALDAPRSRLGPSGSLGAPAMRSSRPCRWSRMATSR